VTHYGPFICSVPIWNHFETATQCVNYFIEDSHYTLQALHRCHRPTLCSFMKEIEKYRQMPEHHSCRHMLAHSLLVSDSRTEQARAKRHRPLLVPRDILVYPPATAHLSHISCVFNCRPTLCSKKEYTKLMAVTLSNLNRFFEILSVLDSGEN